MQANENYITQAIVDKDGLFGAPLTSNEKKFVAFGLFLKILVGSYFASNQLTDLFVPFINQVVIQNDLNPYLTFVSQGKEHAFPYGAFMLYLLSIPSIIFSFLPLEHSYSTLLSIKIVILVSDIGIYLVLRSFVPYHSRIRLAWLYWLSPIIFYVNYVHGQLDVIPIFLSLLTIMYLASKRVYLAGVFFGLAMATKLNVLIITPLLILYLIQGLRMPGRVMGFLVFSLLTFAVINYPFIIEQSFINMVLFNEQQSKLFNVVLTFGGLSLYIVQLIFVVTIFFAYKISISNKRILLIFTGFFFSIILIVMPPSIGWYYWVLPFFAYFYSRERQLENWYLVALTVFYFLYVFLDPHLDISMVFPSRNGYQFPISAVYHTFAEYKIDPKIVINLNYTFLQVTLLILSLELLRFGILRYRIEKITGQPFWIGIGGNSGVGKSLLASTLQVLFGGNNLAILCGDDTHRWERGDKNWRSITHLNPKANFLHREIRDIEKIKSNGKIFRRKYDHNTGRFTKEFSVHSKKLMILEGLHPFFLGNQRSLFDLRIFIEPQSDLAIHWKAVRDSTKRGHSLEEVKNLMKSREIDLIKFVASQKQFADVIISPKARQINFDIGQNDVELNIDYELTMINAINLDDIVSILLDFPELKISHEYKDVNHQRISISGHITYDHSLELLENLREPLSELDASLASLPRGLWGVVVFIIAMIIFQEANNDYK